MNCSSLISITSLSVTCCYGVEQTSFYWINLIQTCSQPSLLWGFLAFRFPDELLSSKDHVFTFKVFKHVGLLLYWRIVKRGCSIVASGIQNHSIVHRDSASLNYWIINCSLTSIREHVKIKFQTTVWPPMAESVENFQQKKNLIKKNSRSKKWLKMNFKNNLLLSAKQTCNP